MNDESGSGSLLSIKALVGQIRRKENREKCEIFLFTIMVLPIYRCTRYVVTVHNVRYLVDVRYCGSTNTG
jgi:hypothetical protein